MIRNEDDYRRRDQEDDLAVLREMSVEESIAIGEALLTSEVMRLAVFPQDDHPCSLAIALGIAPRPAGRHAAYRDAGE